MKLLVLPKYNKDGASSRVRFYNLLPYFSDSIKVVNIIPLFAINNTRILSGFFFITFIVKSYINRIVFLLKTRGVDCVWLQNELFPFVPYFIEILFWPKNKVIIMDFDDPVFLRYREGNFISKFFLKDKIFKLMKNADLVFVSSDYMYKLLTRLGYDNIKVLYPSIEIISDCKITAHDVNKKYDLLWIGSPSTFNFLIKIKNDLSLFCNRFNIKLVVIGVENSNELSEINNVEFIKWSDKACLEAARNNAVGLMPISINSIYGKARDFYKVLTYLSLGVSVIADRIDSTSRISSKHDSILVVKNNDWYSALLKYHLNSDYFHNSKKKNFDFISNNYCCKLRAFEFERNLLELVNNDN